MEHLLQLEKKDTNLAVFIKSNMEDISKYLKISMNTIQSFNIEQIKNATLEKLYTKGHKFLATKVVKFNDKEIEVNIYKSRVSNPSKTRFLVWFKNECFCAIAWSDSWSWSINDVSKSGIKNWYSHADYRTAKALGFNTNDENLRKNLREFAEILGKEHKKLTGF